MKKVLVRCWQIENYRAGTKQPDQLFITYPENDMGYELITCLNCGHLYASNVNTELYVGPPLEIKVKELKCLTCRKPLENNYEKYPETYVANGRKYSYQQSMQIPDDTSSIVKEFDGIYD